MYNNIYNFYFSPMLSNLLHNKYICEYGLYDRYILSCAYICYVYIAKGIR